MKQFPLTYLISALCAAFLLFVAAHVLKVALRETSLSTTPEKESEVNKVLPILLPSEGSNGRKRVLMNEQEFRIALSKALEGDIDYMEGLVSWYLVRRQEEEAKRWMVKVDELRKVRGLPPLFDIHQ